MKQKNASNGAPIRWSIKEVIVGNTFWVLVWTILLSVVLIQGINSGMTYILNLHRENSVMIYNYGLGIFSLVLVVPAAALSVLLLKIWGDFKLARMTPEAAATRHARDIKFKWSPLYCLPIGYVLLIVLYLFVSMPLSNLVKEMSNPALSAILMLVLLFGPLALVLWGIPVCNHKMIQLTGTNQELIQEIWAGEHNHEIPQKYQNQQDLSAITMILGKGQISNVRGAVLFYQLYQIYAAIARVCKPIMIVLGILLAFLTLGLFRFIGREFENACSNMAQGVKDWEPSWNQQDSSFYEQEQSRKQKWFEASQAEKKARFDEYQSRKATNYNANTYHAYRKANLADESRRKADKLNREKYW